MRAVLLSLTMFLSAVASATDVQGTLSGDTVWKREGSPYVLTGDVTVGWGSRLTVESGVQVIASDEDLLNTGTDPKRVELIVDGTLLVRGTANRPVVFTSQGGEGSWYGIRVRGGRGTVIEGALINRAQQGLSLGMSAVVRNTSVSAVARDCLHVSWGKPSLEGNDLSGCGGGSPDPRGPEEPRAARPQMKESPPPMTVPMTEGSPPARPMAPSPTAESRAPVDRAPMSRPPEPRLASPPPVNPPAAPMAGGTAGGMAGGAMGRPMSSPETSGGASPETTPRVKPPPTPAPPARASGGGKDSGTGKPETCSPIPQVNESPACPGYRRWKKEEGGLGAVPPGATRPLLPSPQLTASPLPTASN